MRVDQGAEARAQGAAMSDEARRDKRYASMQRISVRCESWGEFAELYAADVSRGGMFIVTDRELPILGEIELSLQLPGGHDVNLKATVVHAIGADQAAGEQKRAGVGVQFTDLDELRKRQIQQLILFANEANAFDANSAQLASRMFESAVSLPPSRVLGALPPPEPTVRDTASFGPGGAAGSGQPPARRSGQPGARISLRARATSKTPPGASDAPAVESRPSRRTGEQPLGSSNPAIAPGEPASDAPTAADGSTEIAAAERPLKPVDPEQLKLGMTHFAHRRFDQAIKVFEAIVAESADRQAQHWLHMARARLRLKKGDADGAAAHYKRALEVDETNHEARKFVRDHHMKKRLNSLPFGRYFMKKS